MTTRATVDYVWYRLTILGATELRGTGRKDGKVKEMIISVGNTRFMHAHEGSEFPEPSGTHTSSLGQDCGDFALASKWFPGGPGLRKPQKIPADWTYQMDIPFGNGANCGELGRARSRFPRGSRRFPGGRRNPWTSERI